MTHPFSILWDAMPLTDREQVDRNVTRILAELDEQEQQHAPPRQNASASLKQPLAGTARICAAQ
jgi:hypothetical protein